MLIGFLLAFSITDKAWQKFQNNPTFTSLVLNPEKVKITFPTISVCPDSAADPKKVSILMKRSGIDGNDTKELVEFLSAISNFSYGHKGLRSIIMSDSVEDYVGQLITTDPRTLAFQTALSCDHLFHSCKFNNKIIECCKVFYPVVSEKGFCYSFNSKMYGTPFAE